MATNTGGGTTTSLNNTPQAVDDFYTANEDEILYFSVMANDLGGNAKVLWSVDNTSDDGSGDLVAKDVAGVCEYSELGAKISLTSDGRIKYDTTLLDSLAAGQTVTDQFTYAIRLANGTLSWATVTVTLTGTNDGPDIFVGAGDSAAANLDETNAPLSASGTLSVVDVDTSDVVDTSVTSVAVAGNQGTLTEADLKAMLTLTGGNDLAANSGDANNLTWNFNSSPEAFDFLAEGQTLILTYTLTSTDNDGASDTQTVTVTITGTNDGPVANADTDTTGENTSLLVDVLANDTDADEGAVLTVTAASAPAGQGSASIVANQVQFDPGTDFDYLAIGETAQVVINYALEDEHGASSSATVTITVTGTNDGPDAVADLASTDEDNSILVDVLANDSDPDASDVLTISDAEVSSGLGSVVIEDGKLRYDPGSDYNYLAVGESAEVVVSYSVDDGHGGSDSATLTITVTGTNDGPDAVADLASTDEDNSVLVDVLANDSDPDASDVLTISDAEVSSGLGSVVIEDGKLRYDPGSDYNYLAVGESAEVVVSYSVDDGHGGSDSATLTITVTGTNDGPDAVADLASTDEDNSVLVDVLANDSDPDASDVLTISDAEVSSGLGSVVIEDGKLRYDPGSDYNYLAVGESAEVVVSYSVDDGHGGSDSATLTITVTGTNDGPDAVADLASTDEDNSVLVDVLANDSDPDASDVLTISDAEVSSGLGSVVIEDGKLRYDPGSDYNYLAVGESAEVVVSYSVDDGHGGSDSATLTITVTGTNDGPDAVADLASTDEDNSVLVDVLANDSDPDSSDVLTISDAEVSSGLGSVVIEDGKLRYDPGSDYNYLAVGESAEVVVSYSVDDGHGGSDSATLTITVTGTNDGPDAVADLASTDEDNSVLVDVLANDSDPDSSDTLTISDAEVSSGLGSVVIEDGKLRYDPGSDYNYLAVGESAEVVVSYSVDDGHGGSDSATLTITVTGTNDGPDAVADLASTDEDNSVLVDVLANDSDPDASDVLTISDAEVSSGLGSVVIEDGKLRYDPGSDYNYLAVGESAEVVVSYSVDDGHGGSDSATLTITVTGTNDGPDAVADLASTDEDNSVLVDVLANDSDPDSSDVLTISDAEVSSGLGSVVIEDGKLRYDPGSDYNYLAVGESAEVVVSYSVDDGHGGSDSATLTITVTGTNDGPDAVADLASTDEDNSVLVDVLANDSDPDSSDVLTISDAEVSSGLGSVVIEDGKLRYDPGSDYNYLAVGESAEVVVSYSVDDGHGGSDSATLTITVTGTNDGPDAVADLASTDEDNSVLVDVLANDSDPDASDVLTISDAEVSSGLGSVVIEDGKLRYDPGSDYNYLAVGESAEVVVSYSVDDGHGGSDSATLTITVTGTNDAPLAETVSLGSYHEDGLRTITPAELLAGASDPEGDTLTITNLVIASGGGTLYTNLDGTWSYRPDENSSGPVTFTYTVTDGSLSTSGTANLTILPSNDPPYLDLNPDPETNAATLNYTAGTGTAVIAPGALVTDVDSPDFDGGYLTVHFAQGGTSGDTLAIRNQGTGAGQIGVSGSNVTYGGVVIGTFTGGTAGTQLSINFNANATQAAVSALAENITFATTGTGAASKEVHFWVSDGDGTANFGYDLNGAVAFINVAPASTPPVADNDAWVLSDVTSLPAGTITPAWFLNNDTDSDSPMLYVTNVTGLPPGMAANYDPSGHLISITGTTPAAGSFSLGYTVTDGVNSTTATVGVTVIDTSSGTDNVNFNTTYNGTDFSYVDLLSGGDTAVGDTTLLGNAGIDIFVGNNGNDTLSGGGGNDQLFGNENTDTLNGEAGNDRLDGGNGTDTLNGGLGSDILTGGAGNDIFIFNSALGAGNVDTITDFDANNNDKIHLDDAIFGAIGATLAANEFVANVGGNAVDANDFILYDTATGNLYYDADGSGAGVKVLFAQLNLPLVGGALDVTDFSII